MSIKLKTDKIFDGLMTIDEVIGATHLSRSTIYLYISKGTFPAAVKIGHRQSRWKSASVLEWIKNQVGDVPSLPTEEPEQHQRPAPSVIYLRDYFAANAMQGFLASPDGFRGLDWNLHNGKTIIENAAIVSYDIADAMLKAREA